MEPRYESFLTELGAKQVPHSAGRTLYEHLAGTHDILSEWRRERDVCVAGLFHSIYGTEYFKHACLPLSERPRLQELIGPAAEELAYQFCTTPRNRLEGHALSEIRRANNFEQDFARCWPWLEKSSLVYGYTHKREHILQRICRNTAFFFSEKTCAAVVDITNHPTGLKSLNIWIVGGELKAIEKLVNGKLADFGRARGCHRMVANGREGWVRACGSVKLGIRVAKMLVDGDPKLILGTGAYGD